MVLTSSRISVHIQVSEVILILEIGDWIFGGEYGACQFKFCISNFYYQNQYKRSKINTEKFFKPHCKIKVTKSI